MHAKPCSHCTVKSKLKLRAVSWHKKTGIQTPPPPNCIAMRRSRSIFAAMPLLLCSCLSRSRSPAVLTAVVTLAGNAVGNARSLVLARGYVSVNVSVADAAVCARTNARHMLMVSLFKRKV